jgi:3-deoxy-D-manno-octulosonic acid kinase
VPAFPPGYTEIRVDGARAIVRTPVLEFVRDAIRSHGTLYEFAAARPGAEKLRGRGVLYVIEGPGPGRWVVRHLHRGGLLAPLTRDRFLRVGPRRPHNELRVSCALRSLGIPTPEVLVSVVYPSGIIYRGDVARDEVPDARDLADCLFGEPSLDEADRIAAMAAAGRLVRWLHLRGVIHPDLNLRNILLEWAGRPPRPYVLDLDKCRTVARVPASRRRRMLRRLRRSARRFEERTGRRIGDHEWECFEMAYHEVPHEA